MMCGGNVCVEYMKTCIMTYCGNACAEYMKKAKSMWNGIKAGEA